MAVGGIKITILNVYVPNDDCPRFFKKVADLLADKSEGIILMGGDCNCTLNPKLDRLPATTKSLSKMSKGLLNMMKEVGLVEAYFHPNERDFTFTSQVYGS